MTFDSQGGSTVDPITVTYGGSYESELPTSTYDGYTFSGWYTEADENNVPVTLTYTGKAIAIDSAAVTLVNGEKYDETNNGEITYTYYTDKGCETPTCSEGETASGAEWTEFSDSFDVEPENSCVVYVKITDDSGNSTVINSDGILDTTVNGLIPYDGERFLFAAGRLVSEHNGLWLNAASIGGDKKWYFLAEGRVCDVSQVVMYDGAWFIVKNGIFDSSCNGTIVYDGATFTVVNGQLYG